MKKKANPGKASKKGKLGRPLTYTEDIIARTLSYLDGCKDDVDEFHKTRGEKSDSYDRLVRAKLPTIEGLSLHLGVHRDTIYSWEALYPDFSDTLERLRTKQKEMLTMGGLSGDYNPMIAKLILSTNHGMSDKSVVDHTLNVSPERKAEIDQALDEVLE